MRLIGRATEGHEPRLSLWTLTFSPTIWAFHFLACYVLGAVICARGVQGPIDLPTYRWVVMGGTALALGLIVAAGWESVRIWGFGANDPPHDEATDRDRRHFLAYASLLLCGLSFVATVFTALPVAIIQDCR